MRTIKDEWKVAALATWICGMLAHAYRFFNYLLTADTMYCLVGTGSTYASGRWFLEFVGKISTDYEFPWVNGVWSLIYIYIAVILIIELFELRTKWAIVLTAAVVVTFPAVTSAFVFMFTADGYMLAFMLAVLGVYLTERYKYGVVSGIICICISMSIYQAYLSVSLVLVVVLCVKRLLIEEYSFFKTLLQEYKHGIGIVAGALLNKVLTDLVLQYKGIALVGYQGINDVHVLTIEDNIKAVKKSFDGFKYFFGLGNAEASMGYSLVNRCVFILLFIFTVYYIVKKRVYRRPFELLCVIVAYLCVPLLAFIINFVTVLVAYHSIMIMSLCLVYVTLIIYMDSMPDDGKVYRVLRTLVIGVLCLVSYVNILYANQTYYSMNMSYEKSYAIGADVLSRIEAIEEFDGSQKIAIIGDYSAKTDYIEEPTPMIAGVTNGSFLTSQYHYITLWSYSMGREYEGASTEEVMNLQEEAEYLEMNIYPYSGCVQIIDDIVVVKMAE